MRQIIFIVLLVGGVFVSSLAQNKSHHHSLEAEGITRCSFVEENHHCVQHPEDFERWMREAESFSRTGEDTLITIPVVFHIIHTGQEENKGSNISQALINAQIEQVNNDLRKKVGTSGDNNFAVGADTKIELRLATYDPDNNILPQPGINRVNALELETTGNFSFYYINGYIKPTTQWNPSEYLNVWVCPIQGGILGYAQFPQASGLTGISNYYNFSLEKDGIVLNYLSVGSTEMPNPAAQGAYTRFNKGRTLTHELGHWLGLRHIWGDGNCNVDDFCNDTPRASSYNLGCPSNSNTCGSQNMVQNYMDYTDDTCMNVFTNNQKTRMRTVMYHSPRREELRNSNKANPPSTPLPVELFDFIIHRDNKDIILKWSTASEENNSHFILERSNDGVDFTPLATIDGVGNSTTLQHYSYEDESPLVGDNYYRLYQVDFDGKTTDLGTKVMKFTTDLNMSIHPNPVSENIKITFTSQSNGKMNIQIFDSKGQVVHQQFLGAKEGKNTATIAATLLPKGIYIARITNTRNQKFSTRRFIKN